MTKSLATLSNSDMAVFSPDEIRRAGELLGVPLDEASAIKALIIQRDTGLSITRGEISIIPMGGKPTVFINKQGYLAYAARQPEYDGYEFGIEEKNGDTYAWCQVFRYDRTRPTYEDAWLSEDKQNTPVWAKMPKRMLVKVAIKRAHQAAFPVLNGLYDPAEAWDNSVRIEQRDDDIVIVPDGTPEPVKQAPKQTKPAPVKTQKHAEPIEIYDLETAQKVRKNMIDKGMDISIFEADGVRISPNEFNRTMIDADFKRQRGAQKAAAAIPVSKPEEEPKHACPKCGGEPMTAAEREGLLKILAADDESLPPHLCKACGKLILDAATEEPVKQEPVKTTPKPKEYPKVCADCGKLNVLASDDKISIPKYGVSLCPKCYKARLQAAIDASNAAKTTDTQGYVCSVCGAEITKVQKDTCDLFGTPIMCKDCEKKTDGGAA